MHFLKLDLNLLVALDSLIEERSVSRAAIRQNLSQSAMSSALNRLREYFGDELFVTDGRSMEPTALARALAPQVRNILQQIRVTIETRPTFDPATSRRTLRLMASDYITEVLMADVARQLACNAPDIQLQLFPAGDESIAMFERRELDVMIMPGQFIPQDHPHSMLFMDRYCCVVWSENRSVSDPLTPEQFMAMGHVAIHLDPSRLSDFEHWLKYDAPAPLSAHRRVELAAPGFAVVPYLIVGTQRIATVPLSLARSFQKVLPIRVIEPPPGFPAIREMIVWHRTLEGDPCIRWFIDLLSSFAASSTRVAPGLVDQAPSTTGDIPRARRANMAQG